MRKILIPTDFSKNSLNAIKYATELFKHGPTDIYLLHSFYDEVYEAKSSLPNAVFQDLKDNMMKKKEAELESLKKEIFSFSPNPKHTLQTIVEFRLLVDSVNDWVDKENIDVVVMGTKGKTSDKLLTFGSNTLQVIKYVKCPVLAIPSGYSPSTLENILFSTDYMMPYKRRELRLLSNMAKNFAAHVDFLYVSKFENLSLRQLDNQAFLEATFADNHVGFHQIDDEGVAQAINNFIIKKEVDMLVMTNTRHSYLENILYQSTIEKIGLQIDIPFLVLQNLPR
ncbi:MAG TPA: universal stress protein [Aequorivita sp.]|nr:universal stress protein [Aequorivita sp.]